MADDSSFKNKVFNDITKKFNEEKNALPKEYNKELTAIYTDRYNAVKKYFDDSLIITDKEINNYLQSVFAEIKRSNPVLQKMDIHLLLCRAWWPNAATYGEGVILFNAGLFSRLNNEAEMAFVICHELAHAYFDHGGKAINNYVQTINSKDYQQRLKEIQNSPYAKRTMVEDLLKTVSYNSRSHGREHESQADSMALVWLANTVYNPNAALTCLAMLDSADKDKYDVTPDLKSFFNFPEYPFKKEWGKEEESFFSKMANAQKEENKALADSLKTHPDCKKRIEYLQRYMPAAKSNALFIVAGETDFKNRQLQCDYEILNYTYTHGYVSQSIFYTLQMDQVLGDNAYLVSNIGRCLNKMYTAQKNHTLNFITDLPSPGNEKYYNDFLEFIQKLSLNDIGSIAYYYMRFKAGSFAADKDFADTFNTSRKNINK